MDPSNNSFYASFKIYINKLQSVQKQQQQPQQQNHQNQPQIVRIEQIQSSFEEDEEENVFLDTPQNVEVQIKVDPPQQQHQTPKVTTSSKENSPVFYLEPEDWTEIEEATQKISPCCGGAGKSIVGFKSEKKCNNF